MQAGFASMLVAPPRPGRTTAFLALFLAVFCGYAAAAAMVLRPPAPGRGAWPALPILGLALLFRATFLFAQPALSDDLYRYLWDGRTVWRCGDPYVETPASVPGGGRVAGRPLAHPEVPTIYPPAAQALFAAGAALSEGPLGIKAILVLCEVLGIAALRRLLALRGLPPDRILIYAWNPLPVVEVAWSGHLEPAGTACVLAAAAAIIQKRDLRASLALALGGLVKIVPLALLLPFARAVRARALLAVPAVLVLGYWPFRGAGPRLFDGLREYSGRWVANESLFGVIHRAIAALDPTPPLKSALAWARAHVPGSAPLDLLYPYLYPPYLARAACAAAALAFAATLLRRRVEPLRGAYLLTGVLLLVSPTLHPWYLLWILPWLCLFPSGPWILLSGLVALAYANLGSPGREAEPHPWVRLVEYLPFYAWLAAGWTRSRLAAHRPGSRALAAPRRG